MSTTFAQAVALHSDHSILGQCSDRSNHLRISLGSPSFHLSALRGRFHRVFCFFGMHETEAYDLSALSLPHLTELGLVQPEGVVCLWCNMTFSLPK